MIRCTLKNHDGNKINLVNQEIFKMLMDQTCLKKLIFRYGSTFIPIKHAVAPGWLVGLFGMKAEP